ncbi:hypothetical protein L3Y34_015134 [Caenorhabditis briggsae]|uniref:Protein kinase domain-containing protein n=1 Tax=Caenorhabditis briggsae TaxID=6238 RepID=A0AAE9DVS9_CAEBR|nr:hypothetical protein L3Y34_015134 [Caenorhabditis briggsae]
MVSSGEDRAAAGKSAPPGDDVASDSDADGAEEILEESPDKRWSKRREQVKQRDVPGIDVAYLAMDNETGNEVVWNEVQFSERKNFRAQEEKINAVFDNLTQLVHTNLVKFHKYWTDSKSEKPRIIFITEYMSSGSMSAFLQRTRKAGSPLSIKAWKKWTTQILSALNYLHSSDPPIIHGNLTCNTVFIQQNGLIKIGCGISMCKDVSGHNLLVAPDAINHHVKTCRENMRYMHYIAPEYEILDNTELTSAADIYSFGICSLEIAVIGGLSGCQNGSSEGPVTEDVIEKAIRSLEDPMQQDFIRQCLRKDPAERPSARELLFHQILFEVHSLKLLSAHSIVDSKKYEDVPESAFRIKDNEQIAATSKLREMAYCQVAAFQVDLEKFLDDVRNGIYPLTAFAPLAHQPSTTLRAYSNTNPPTLLTSDTLSAPSSTHPSANTTITAETTAVASAALQLNVSGTTVNGNGSTSQSSIYKATVADQPEKKISEPNGNDAIGGGGAAAMTSSTTLQNASEPAEAQGTSAGSTGGGDAGGSSEEDGGAGEELTNEERDNNMRLENRHILEINVHIENEEMSIVLLLEDQMHRQLTTSVNKTDNPASLTENLITHGFMCQLDSAGVERAISEAFEIRAARQAEVQQQEDENDTSLREPNPDDPLPPQSSSTAPPVENGTLTTSLISTPTSISKMNPSPLVLPPPQATSTPTPAPLPSKPTTMTMTSSDASAVTSSSKTS